MNWFKKILKGLLFVLIFIQTNIYASNKISSFRFSPSYFIPNQSFNKNGNKILSNNPNTTAFIQTLNGTVKFTSHGIYIGFLTSENSNENSESEYSKELLKNRQKLLNNYKLVVMGIGFKNKNDEKKKSVTPILEEKTSSKNYNHKKEFFL